MAQITASEFATEVGTTPREVRKFLRADAKAQGTATPGKGARYAIEKREVRALKARYAKWDEARQVEATEAPDEVTDAPDAD